MVTRQSQRKDLEVDELTIDGGQMGPDSAGQSGDTQLLSMFADAADESVAELAEEGQDWEADIAQGVEDAADHPEKPVPTHQHDRRPPGPDRD